MRRVIAVGVLTATLVLSAAARADDVLPPPRVVPGVSVPLPPPVFRAPPPPYYRTSAYAVWQYYGVNRAGQWRPRVLYLPHAAFYLETGRPYPWAVNYNTEFMPYARD
jgi:hypothetical protein